MGSDPTAGRRGDKTVLRRCGMPRYKFFRSDSEQLCGCRFSGADFLCKLMCGAVPVNLRGFQGPRDRPDPENDRFFINSLNPHPLTGYLKAILRDFSGATKWL